MGRERGGGKSDGCRRWESGVVGGGGLKVPFFSFIFGLNEGAGSGRSRFGRKTIGPVVLFRVEFFAFNACCLAERTRHLAALWCVAGMFLKGYFVPGAMLDVVIFWPNYEKIETFKKLHRYFQFCP